MKIGIIGLGVIGGSLALALRKAGHEVIAIDSDEATQGVAIQRGAADKVSGRYEDLSAASVVFLATPLGTVIEVGQHVLPLLSVGTILCDVASVKVAIVEALTTALPKGIHFVGGHPMFGTERRGIDAAAAELVAGAPFIVTPTEATSPDAVEVITRLVSEIGMRAVRMLPDEHDSLLATLSHVPLLLGAALSLQADDTSCAGNSFRDATRVAMSPPHMLSHIVALNREPIREAISRLSTTLNTLLDMDVAHLEAALHSARARRLMFQNQRLQPTPHGARP